MTGPTVTVVLPTYNESETVVGVIEEVFAALDVAEIDGEVLVVDDDSPDETWQLVREEFADDDRVSVLHRTDARGLSSAIFEGIREADGAFTVVMDADGQHPPQQVPALLSAFVATQGLDPNVVIGSRHVDGGSIEGWSRRRLLISDVARSLARMFVPAVADIDDPMSGFFAVRREAALAVLDECDPHGFKALVELVGRMDDPRIVEVPITFRSREAGESTLTVDGHVRFLEHILSLRLVHHGLDDRLVTPRVVRSIEVGIVAFLAIPLLFLGTILAGADGWIGVGLIAAVGSLTTLATQRIMRTGQTWESTEEHYA